jgi:quinol-cytochrome oxidoreductase complex cytochrome b subunit
MCYVFEHELKTIGSANSKTSLDIGFFSASFGAFIAFAITLGTVDINNPYVYATFWAVCIVAGLSTVFFLIRYLISRKESKQEVIRILEESRNREADFPQ